MQSSPTQSLITVAILALWTTLAHAAASNNNGQPPLADKSDDSTWFIIMLVGGLVGGHLLMIGVVFAVMWARESKTKTPSKSPFVASSMEELKQMKQRIGKQD